MYRPNFAFNDATAFAPEASQIPNAPDALETLRASKIEEKKKLLAQAAKEKKDSFEPDRYLGVNSSTDADTLRQADEKYRISAREGSTFDAWETKKSAKTMALIKANPKKYAKYRNRIDKQKDAYAVYKNMDVSDVTDDMIYAQGQAAHDHFKKLAIEEQTPDKVMGPFTNEHPLEAQIAWMDSPEGKDIYNRNLGTAYNPKTNTIMADAMNTPEWNAKFFSKYNQKKVDLWKAKEENKSMGDWVGDALTATGAGINELARGIAGSGMALSQGMPFAETAPGSKAEALAEKLGFLRTADSEERARKNRQDFSEFFGDIAASAKYAYQSDVSKNQEAWEKHLAPGERAKSAVTERKIKEFLHIEGAPEWLNNSSDWIAEVATDAKSMAEEFGRNPSSIIDKAIEEGPSALFSVLLMKGFQKSLGKRYAKDLAAADSVKAKAKVTELYKKKINTQNVSIGASTEGLEAAGNAVTSLYEDIDKMSHEDFMKTSENYRNYIANGLSEAEARFNITKQAVNKLSSRTFLATAGMSAITGAPLESKLAGNIAANNKKSILDVAGEFAKTTAKETLQEGFQNPTEKIIENVVAKTITDPGRKSSEGVGEALVEGLVVGAGTPVTFQVAQPAIILAATAAAALTKGIYKGGKYLAKKAVGKGDETPTYEQTTLEALADGVKNPTNAVNALLKEGDKERSPEQESVYISNLEEMVKAGRKLAKKDKLTQTQIDILDNADMVIVLEKEKLAKTNKDIEEEEEFVKQSEREYNEAVKGSVEEVVTNLTEHTFAGDEKTKKKQLGVFEKNIQKLQRAISIESDPDKKIELIRKLRNAEEVYTQQTGEDISERPNEFFPPEEVISEDGVRKKLTALLEVEPEEGQETSYAEQVLEQAQAIEDKGKELKPAQLIGVTKAKGVIRENTRTELKRVKENFQAAETAYQEGDKSNRAKTLLANTIKRTLPALQKVMDASQLFSTSGDVPVSLNKEFKKQMNTLIETDPLEAAKSVLTMDLSMDDKVDYASDILEKTEAEKEELGEDVYNKINDVIGDIFDEEEGKELEEEEDIGDGVEEEEEDLEEAPIKGGQEFSDDEIQSNVDILNAGAANPDNPRTDAEKAAAQAIIDKTLDLGSTEGSSDKSEETIDRSINQTLNAFAALVHNTDNTPGVSKEEKEAMHAAQVHLEEVLLQEEEYGKLRGNKTASEVRNEIYNAEGPVTVRTDDGNLKKQGLRGLLTSARKALAKKNTKEAADYLGQYIDYVSFLDRKIEAIENQEYEDENTTASFPYKKDEPYTVFKSTSDSGTWASKSEFDTKKKNFLAILKAEQKVHHAKLVQVNDFFITGRAPSAQLSTISTSSLTRDRAEYLVKVLEAVGETEGSYLSSARAAAEQRNVTITAGAGSTINVDNRTTTNVGSGSTAAGITGQSVLDKNLSDEQKTFRETVVERLKKYKEDLAAWKKAAVDNANLNLKVPTKEALVKLTTLDISSYIKKLTEANKDGLKEEENKTAFAEAMEYLNEVNAPDYDYKTSKFSRSKSEIRQNILKAQTAINAERQGNKPKFSTANKKEFKYFNFKGALITTKKGVQKIFGKFDKSIHIVADVLQAAMLEDKIFFFEDNEYTATFALKFDQFIADLAKYDDPATSTAAKKALKAKLLANGSSLQSALRFHAVTSAENSRYTEKAPPKKKSTGATKKKAATLFSPKETLYEQDTPAKITANKKSFKNIVNALINRLQYKDTKISAKDIETFTRKLLDKNGLVQRLITKDDRSKEENASLKAVFDEVIPIVNEGTEGTNYAKNNTFAYEHTPQNKLSSLQEEPSEKNPSGMRSFKAGELDDSTEAMEELFMDLDNSLELAGIDIPTKTKGEMDTLKAILLDPKATDEGKRGAATKLRSKYNTIFKAANTQYEGEVETEHQMFKRETNEATSLDKSLQFNDYVALQKDEKDSSTIEHKENIVKEIRILAAIRQLLGFFATTEQRKELENAFEIMDNAFASAEGITEEVFETFHTTRGLLQRIAKQPVKQALENLRQSNKTFIPHTGGNSATGYTGVSTSTGKIKEAEESIIPIASAANLQIEKDSSLKGIVLPSLDMSDYKKSKGVTVEQKKEAHRGLLETAYPILRAALASLPAAYIESLDENIQKGIAAFLSKEKLYDPENKTTGTKPSRIQFAAHIKTVVTYEAIAEVVSFEEESSSTADIVKAAGTAAEGTASRETNNKDIEKALKDDKTVTTDQTIISMQSFPRIVIPELSVETSPNGPSVLQGATEESESTSEKTRVTEPRGTVTTSDNDTRVPEGSVNDPATINSTENTKPLEGLGEIETAKAKHATHVLHLGATVAAVTKWVTDNTINTNLDDMEVDGGKTPVLYLSIDPTITILSEHIQDAIKKFLNSGGVVVTNSAFYINGKNASNIERDIYNFIKSQQKTRDIFNQENINVASWKKTGNIIKTNTVPSSKDEQPITISDTTHIHKFTQVGKLMSATQIKETVKAIKSSLAKFGYTLESINQFIESSSMNGSEFLQAVKKEILNNYSKADIAIYIKETAANNGLPKSNSKSAEMEAVAIALVMVRNGHISDLINTGIQDASMQTETSNAIPVTETPSSTIESSLKIEEVEREGVTEENPLDMATEAAKTIEDIRNSLIRFIEAIGEKMTEEHKKDLDALRSRVLHKGTETNASKKAMTALVNSLLQKYKKQFQGVVFNTFDYSNENLTSNDLALLESLSLVVYYNEETHAARNALLEEVTDGFGVANTKEEVKALMERVIAFQLEHGFATAQELLIDNRIDASTLTSGNTSKVTKGNAKDFFSIMRRGGYGILSRIPGFLSIFAEEHQGNLEEELDIQEDEKALILHMAEFAKKFKKAFKKKVHPYTGDGSKDLFQERLIQNPILFLMDQSKRIPDLILDASAVVLHEYLGKRGTETLSGDVHAIASFLGIDKSKVTPDMFALLGDGVHQNILAAQLGARIARLINVGIQNVGDPHMQARYELALGKQAIIVGHNMGIFEFHSVTQTEIDEVMGKETVVNDEINVVEVTDADTGAYGDEINVHFVKLKGEYNAELVSDEASDKRDPDNLPYEDLPEGFIDFRKLHRAAKDLAEKLFGIEKHVQSPQHTPPTARQTYMQRGHTKLSKIFQEGLRRATKVKWEPITQNADVFMNLPKKTVLQIFGYQEDFADEHIDKRASIEAKNRQLEREYSAVLEYLNNPENRIDEDMNKGFKPMYFGYVIQKFGRMSMQSTTINPQNSKMHRHLFGIQSWNVEVKVSPDAADVDGMKALSNFKMAIAEGFGISIDKNTIEESMAEFHDQIMNSKGELNSNIKKAVESIVAFRKDRSIGLDKTAIREAIGTAGEVAASYGAIMALADYHMSDGKKFNTSIFFEADGVTNGVISTAMQIVPSSEIMLKQHMDLLRKGAIKFEGDEGDFSAYSKTHDDAYKTTTKVAGKVLSDMEDGEFTPDEEETTLAEDKYLKELGKEGLKELVAAFKLLTFALMDEKGEVTKDGRIWAKYPLMISNYQGGMAAIKRAMSTDMLTSAFDNVLAAAKKAMASEGESDNEVKIAALQEILDAFTIISGQEFEAAEEYLSEEGYQALSDTRLDYATKSTFMKNASITYGLALQEGLNELLVTTRESMQLLTATSNIMGAIARGIFDIEREKLVNENGGTPLTQLQIDQLMRDLILEGKAVTIKHHTSSKETDNYEDSMEIFRYEKEYIEGPEGEMSYRTKDGAIVTYDSQGNKKKTSSSIARAFVRVPSANLSVMAVIQAIISTDANVNNPLMIFRNMLNVFDAQGDSIFATDDTTELANMLFLNQHFNWDMMQEFSTTMQRLVAVLDQAEYIDVLQKINSEINDDERSNFIDLEDAVDTLVDSANENTINKNKIHGTITESRQFNKVGAATTTTNAENTPAILDQLFDSTDDTVLGSEEADWDTFEATESVLLTPENVKEEFHKLDAESNDSPEHAVHLESMLDTLIAPVLRTIKGVTLNIGQGIDKTVGRIKGDVIDISLAKTKALFATMMSPREVYVHENLHGALGPALDKYTLIRKVLEKNWNQARAAITPEDFLRRDEKGNPIIYGTYEEEMAIAQKRYDHVFANGKNGLQEFLAMGLSNEALVKVLKKIQYRIGKDGKSISLLDKIISGVNTLFYSVFDSAVLGVRVSSKDSLYDVLEKTANKLMQVQTRQKSRWMKQNILMNKADKIMSQSMANYILPASKNIRNITGKIVDTEIPGVKQVAQGVGAVASIPYLLFDPHGKEAVRMFTKGLYKTYNINKKGLVHQISMEIGKTSKENLPWLRLLTNAKHAIDIGRNNLKNSLNNQVTKMFDSAYSPNRYEWVQINAGALKSDMAALLTHYSKDDLVKLLSSDAYLTEEIKRHRGMLHNNKYYQNQAKGLGLIMATGEAGIHRQMMNAHNVVSMRDVPKKIRKGKDTSVEMLGNVDRLASLYALRYTDRSIRNTTAKFAKHEFARKVSTDGFTFLLEQHNLVKNISLTDNFADNPASMIKGYTYESFDSMISGIVVPANKIKQMEQEGYVVQYKVARGKKAPDPKGTVFMTNASGMQMDYQSGIVALVNRTSKGFSFNDAAKSQVVDPALVGKRTKVMVKNMRKASNIDVLAQITGDVEMDRKSTFMVPTVDVNGRTQDFRYVMNETSKNELLGKKDPANETLGKMLGNIHDKKESPRYNRLVIDDAFAEYEELYEANKEDFLEIRDGSEDPEIQELYDLLPSDMREYAKEKFGSETIYLRAELYNLVMGYRNITILDTVNKYIGGITPPVLKQIIRVAELIWQDVVKVAKRKVVILTPDVLIDNTISNFQISMVAGMPTAYTAVKQAEAGNNLRLYLETEDKYHSLERLISGNPGKATQKQITDRDMAKREMELNPVKPLIDAGAFQSFTEEINFNDDASETKLLERITYKGFGKKVAAVVDGETELSKYSSPALKAYHWLTLAPTTSVGRLLTQATQRSDFIARAAMYEFMTVEKGISHQEAMDTVMETFINYEINTAPEVQYANKMGLLMYTKFWLGFQRVIQRQFRENTARATIMAATDAALIDTPIAYSSFLPTSISTDKITTPFDIISQATDIPIFNYMPEF